MEEDDYEFKDTHCPVCGRDVDPYSGSCYYCGTQLEPLDTNTEKPVRKHSGGAGCALGVFGVVLLVFLALLILKLL